VLLNPVRVGPIAHSRVTDEGTAGDVAVAWMLSQELMVNGSWPAYRRRCRAAVTKPNTELGGSADWTSAMILGLLVSNSPVILWMLYPPSVTVMYMAW
jgi:hypothetical protein